MQVLHTYVLARCVCVMNTNSRGSSFLSGVAIVCMVCKCMYILVHCVKISRYMYYVCMYIPVW